jgi:hypothetical protein
MPAVTGYASGIGSGGPGSNPWIAYAGASSQWFSTATAGDLCYRNTGGRLLFGATGSSAQLMINSTSVNIATSGSLGFYGTTATSRPTAAATTTGFTASTGTTVVSGSTFTGGVGSTAYTIGDIVKALKTLGLIAS